MLNGHLIVVPRKGFVICHHAEYIYIYVITVIYLVLPRM
jgi:hypothetical protein